MSTSRENPATSGTLWDSPGGRVLSAIGRRLFGARTTVYPLNTPLLPIEELPTPPVLRFPLGSNNGMSLPPITKKGTDVVVGLSVTEDPNAPVRRSPVRGTVTGIANAPEIRGMKGGRVVLVEPNLDDAPAPFPPLDLHAPGDVLRQRLLDAGVMTGALRPRMLGEVLDGHGVDRLVVLAADREPGVSVARQLLRDRMDDVPLAARMLGRIAGAGGATIAVLTEQSEELKAVATRHDVVVLALAPVYPNALEPMIAARVGARTAIVSVETALAALDAVREGRPQDRKALTIIAPTGSRNVRVAIGSRIGDVLAAVGVEPEERDKLVAGGPMQGFSQHSLDGAVDAGIDALVLIPASDVTEWSDAPCINCGVCVDVCPQDLQVQLIGRYAEFGIFDRAGELGAADCAECGLCAAACTARRPLLQLIRLAKRELEAMEQAATDAGEAPDETEESRTAAA